MSRRSAGAARPPVVIVGIGRLGGALALGLGRAGWPVSVLPRSPASVNRALELGLRLADTETLATARVCILAVPDAAVPTVAQTLAAELPARTALVHCAGALSLEALSADHSSAQTRGEPEGVRPLGSPSPRAARTLMPAGGQPEGLRHSARGNPNGGQPEGLRHGARGAPNGGEPEGVRPLGSLHPLCAVSAPTDDLGGHSAAVSATTPALRTLLRRMARDLDLRVLEVPEAHRSAYHAGAVLSAGGLVALAQAATEALAVAGISESDALRALLPLMRSAIRGVTQRGLKAGLTGPVARGDAGVVTAHLAALPPELSTLYRALSARALTLAHDALPPATRRALAHALDSPAPSPRRRR